MPNGSALPTGPRGAPPPRKQIAPAFVLAISGIPDLVPGRAGSIWVGQALRDDALQVHAFDRAIECPTVLLDGEDLVERAGVFGEQLGQQPLSLRQWP